MTRCRLSVLILFMFMAFQFVGQTSSSGQSESPAPASGSRAHMGGCWQQAGVPPDIAREGMEIERKIHAQVMAVCNDPSLNNQQKHEQIHQLRAQGMEQVKGLVTEQQAEAYRSCAAAGHRGRGEFGGWPCASRPEGTSEVLPSSEGQPTPSSPANQER
jgi:hypothetical protein